MKAARSFVHQHVLSRYDDIGTAVSFSNPKKKLDELCLQKKWAAPQYSYVFVSFCDMLATLLCADETLPSLIAETGRNTHAPTFRVGVSSDGRLLGEGIYEKFFFCCDVGIMRVVLCSPLFLELIASS